MSLEKKVERFEKIEAAVNKIRFQKREIERLQEELKGSLHKINDSENASSNTLCTGESGKEDNDNPEFAAVILKKMFL